MLDRPNLLFDCVRNADHARAQAATSTDAFEADTWLRLAEEWDEVADSIRSLETVEAENRRLEKSVTHPA